MWVLTVTPHEFAASRGWIRRREELRLEIVAVCIPLVIYAVALTALAGVASTAAGTEAGNPFHTLLGEPDGFFGGCILLAFAVIRAYRQPEIAAYEGHAAFSKISALRIWGLAGLIVCAIVAGIAVMFHPVWAAPVGVVSIYAGGWTYKRVTFFRDYLKAQV